ncbi:MAG: MltA domain-containing protein [Thermoanaerobaculia bacterium]
MKGWRLTAVSVTLLALGACEPAPPPPPPPPPPTEPPPVTRPEEALRPVPPAIFDAFVDGGDRASLRQAVERSRAWYRRLPADGEFIFGPRTVTAAELADAFDRFLSWLDDDPTPEALAARLAEAFEPMASVGSDGRGAMLVTGYYLPVIDGSLRRRRDYQIPVYGRPADIIEVSLGDFSDEWSGRRLFGKLRGRRLVPYPDRRQLREGRELRGREIAWARDKVDLFFIEVQGSGVLKLPGGREIRIGYAGANGRQYRSIGKLLIDEGKVERERMSMQAIRAYLARNPEDVDRVLDYNQSVVFFRKLDGPAVGSLGFPVTAGRSIATDRRLMPKGALGFLATEIPAVGADGATVGAGRLARFVVNQDTGGAIRGPGRVDFFWGRGEEAALRAGLMKQPGRLFFLVPKAPDP